MLGQHAGHWLGLQCADLQTACILWRPCCRSSSEAPTSVAAPSWITARCLASCCQPTTTHLRPHVFMGLFIHRTCFKVSSSSLACPCSQTDDLVGSFETRQEMALPSLLDCLLSGLQELCDGRGASSLSSSTGLCSAVMLLSICRSKD